jgi:peptide-methionine (S)-S-oxide reductase
MKARRLLRLAASVAAIAAIPALSGAGKLDTAIFAGGCFWTMQHGMENVPGVVDTVAGYAGGVKAHPTYQEVSSETTKYLESVKVTYDPSKISYAKLTMAYWHMIDPTDAGGQVCDQGPSYHSAIFVNSAKQREIAEASLKSIDTGPRKGRIATQIRPVTTFWPAETYHQHYADKNPMAYEAYRIGCGRDRRLKVVWNDAAG